MEIFIRNVDFFYIPHIYSTLFENITEIYLFLYACITGRFALAEFLACFYVLNDL